MNLHLLKNKSFSNIVLLASLTIGANSVHASTLLDLNGKPATNNTTYSVSFIATDTGEVISFAGANGSSHTTVDNLSVVDTTTSSGNLFASPNDYTSAPWIVTPAPGGYSLITVKKTSVTFASEFAPDIISQTIHTVVGQEYDISFTVSEVKMIPFYDNKDLSNGGDIFVYGSSVNLPSSSVPEPSSFALLTAGLLGLNFARRKAAKA